MISTKVKVLALFLLVVLCIHLSEEKKFFRKIGKPFEKVGKEIGRGGKKVGKEIERTGKKIGKEIGRGLDKSKDLVKDLVGKPLKDLAKLTYPIAGLLGIRKQQKVEVETEVPETDTIPFPDEPFDVSLVKLHNQLRTEAGSESELKWDNLLQIAAEEWAKKCSISYKVFGDSRDETYGQNIYPVKGSDAEPYNAVQMWKSFSESAVPGKFECKENQDCYPYLQMIWPNTKYIGCGVSNCPSLEGLEEAGSVIVCFYTPL